MQTGDRRHPTLDCVLWLDVHPLYPYRSATANEPRISRKEVAEKLGTYESTRFYWRLTGDPPHVHQLEPTVSVPYDEDL